MADKITWTNERRKLGDLIPWEINPRQIKADQAKRLVESLDEFAQIETIAISPDNEVYNGHQRLKVWQAEHGADYEVDVRVSSRSLTEDERKKLTVYLHKGATGEFDFDLLANNFEIDDLLEWGFEDHDLGLGDNIYTGKVESICYEPVGIKPEVQDLFDDTKAQELIEEINKSEYLSDDEKCFLLYAAYRHIVIDYSKVAEYYANSTADIQKLIEDSALIIIDYNKAIENGFTEFTNGIAYQFKEDYK